MLPVVHCGLMKQTAVFLVAFDSNLSFHFRMQRVPWMFGRALMG